MRTKEEIALMWIVVGIASIVCLITFPIIFILGLVAWCAYNLKEHYSK